MILVFFIALAIISFVLGIRYERQRQHRLKIDYINAMGAMWGQHPMTGESDDEFRIRLVRAMMEPPNVYANKFPEEKPRAIRPINQARL